MKFLIPTAKEMKPSVPSIAEPLSHNSQEILSKLTGMSIDDLATLYKLNTASAEKEALRWQAIAEQKALTYPALEVFNGLMYRQIENRYHSAKNVDYINNHIFITSAFYGIIPAMFPIAQHRLDFNTPLKIKGKSLKTLWKRHYDNFLTHQPEPIVSLLSNEFEQVFSASLRQKLIRLEFFEETNDGRLKKHSTISKKARGQLINAIMQHQPDTIEALKELRPDNFIYQPDLSTEKNLFFVKKT